MCKINRIDQFAYLYDIKDSLNKTAIIRQTSFVNEYEKDHFEDLYDIFSRFRKTIDYKTNSIEINIKAYPELFRNKKMENEFYDYLKLKGFKYEKCHSRLGAEISYVIEIFL